MVGKGAEFNNAGSLTSWSIPWKFPSTPLKVHWTHVVLYECQLRNCEAHPCCHVTMRVASVALEFRRSLSVRNRLAMNGFRTKSNPPKSRAYQFQVRCICVDEAPCNSVLQFESLPFSPFFVTNSTARKYSQTICKSTNSYICLCFFHGRLPDFIGSYDGCYYIDIACVHVGIR